MFSLYLAEKLPRYPDLRLVVGFHQLTRYRRFPMWNVLRCRYSFSNSKGHTRHRFPSVNCRSRTAFLLAFRHCIITGIKIFHLYIVDQYRWEDFSLQILRRWTKVQVKSLAAPSNHINNKFYIQGWQVWICCKYASNLTPLCILFLRISVATGFLFPGNLSANFCSSVS